MDTISIIILAAGVGKRMQSDIPKVMHVLGGKPLVLHVVKAAEQSVVQSKPVVVVSPKYTLVQEYLGDRAVYAIQEQPLGTGDAVHSAAPLLRNAADHIVVLYGDMPFISTASVDQLIETHLAEGNLITIMTTTVPNFDSGYQPFYHYGRIIRNDTGDIVESIELKDTTEEQSKIRELNAGIHCFRADWLWDHLERLHTNNAQGEYYLTDLIRMAIGEGKPISAVSISPEEMRGINSPEDLKLAETKNPDIIRVSGGGPDGI